MIQGGKECCRFLFDIPQEVLPDDKIAMLEEPDPEENDRAREEAERFDIKKM